MCPFRFRVSSYLNSFRVKRSVRSLFSTWYVPEPISAVILAWYIWASRITLARPLSAGRAVMELSSFRLLSASCCFFVMFGVGSCACSRMILTAFLTVSARSSVSSLTADSATLATISVAGTLAGVTAKFRPFFSKDTSASLRVLDDKLITQFDLSIKDVGETEGYCSRNSYSNLRCWRWWYIYILTLYRSSCFSINLEYENLVHIWPQLLTTSLWELWKFFSWVSWLEKDILQEKSKCSMDSAVSRQKVHIGEATKPKG